MDSLKNRREMLMARFFNKQVQGQFTLKEVASDRMMKLKHAELNLDAFWILVDNEYPAIAEKALQFLLQFSTFLCASSDYLL